MKIRNVFKYILTALMISAILCGCNNGSASQSSTGSSGAEAINPTSTPKTTESGSEDDETDGIGDTFIGETQKPDEEKGSEELDIIMFMGQYNMSGEGGDASLAPKVKETAGMEFRAVSDPTRLYQIAEPFGSNENDPSGLNEFPGVKKGSLVSSFVNEYHSLTGRKVIAVSASMSNADMEIWTSQGVMTDVKHRLNAAISFLKDNDCKIGHVYALWRHGETDGLKGSTADSYRKSLDKLMSSLFKEGLEEVFIITPGRTIDYKDVNDTVIKAQTDLCRESKYYTVATTVLSGVSPEYMVDQYHYNQHVLNYVGTEAAKSVAYYTLNNTKKIVYDYKTGEYIVPNGIAENSQEKDAPQYPSEIDINELY